MAFIPYADPAKAAATVPSNYSAYPASNPNSSQNFVNDMGPYATVNGGASNPGGGGYVDPQAQAKADLAAQYAAQAQALQNQYNQLDTTEGVGLGNINNSYNRSLNNVEDQYGVATRDYNTGVQDTTQGYQSARNSAATQARNKLSALQRLLGISGAGNSSASEDAVPLAVAQDASQTIAPVQTSFATNRRNQDTNYGDTTRNYGNSKADLAQQKYGQENALRQSIAQTRAGLLSQIQQANIQQSVAGGANYQSAAAAQGGLTNQVNSLLAQIAQLGNQYANPVLSTGPVNYSAPTLAQYLLNQTGGIKQEGVAGGDTVNPLFGALLGKKDEQQPVATA